MKFSNLVNNYKKLTQDAKGILSYDFTHNNPVRVLFLVSLIFIVAVWIIALFSFGKTTYPVPLRYNSFLGVTELGPWFKLYRLPLFNLLTFFINIFLANAVFKKDRMISYIFLGISIFVGIMSLAVVINLSLLINR